MMNRFYKALCIVLCVCAVLSLAAACGEESKVPKDETQQPSTDEPTADEPTTDEPIVDEPTEPEKPTEPSNPSEPEKPTEPSTPTEPEKPTGPEQPSEPEKPTEPEITWDAEGYQNIVDNYENKALAVYGNKAMVATEDKVQLFYVEYENTTPVMKKYKEFDFSVEKLLVNEHTFGFITTDGDLYQYITFEDGHENGQPTKIMENVKNAVFGIASGMAVKNDGTLWGWENDRIIGTQIFYSLGEPILRATGVSDFDVRTPVLDRYYDINNNYGFLEDGKVDPDKINIKENINDYYQIGVDNSLLYRDTKVVDYVGQGMALQMSHSSDSAVFVTDNNGNLLKIERKSKNNEITKLAENCLYIPKVYYKESYPVIYIDTEYNLWAINAVGEKHLVDTNVIYVPAITSHLWYLKKDNTVWMDGKYAMDMENTIPISPNAADEPEITVAPKPPKASYADEAAKAIADVALGKVKFYDTTTKTFISVDEYGKQEGEQKKFYVMDIDQDGAAEIILRPESLSSEKNILVLHYDGKQVNGYRVISGNWSTMKHNGVVRVNGGNLVKAHFENYEMVIKCVAERKFDEEWDTYRYFINGEQTVKENYDHQYDIWKAQGDIIPYDISKENIEKEVLTEKIPVEPIVISPEAAKAAIRDVLLGKAKLFDTEDKLYATLPEECESEEAWLNEGLDRPDWYRYYVYRSFALVDLDGDGALECILESSEHYNYGYRVLYFDGEKVNMYSTIYRGWQNIKVNGLAWGSGVIATYFKNGQMVTRDLCAYAKNYPFIYFYVNDYLADNHEYNRVEEDYNAQEDVTWYQLNETEIMKMLGDSATPETPAQPNVPDTPTVPSTPSDIGGSQKPSTPTVPTSPSDI